SRGGRHRRGGTRQHRRRRSQPHSLEGLAVSPPVSHPARPRRPSSPVTGALLLGLVLAALPGTGTADGTDQARQRLGFQELASAIANGERFSRARLEERLGDYVLIPYLEHRQLRADLKQLDARRARDFLEREAGTSLGRQFRLEYLGELARREDWKGFLAVDDPATAR